MKKMSSQELTARINRFMDRKLPKAADLSDLAGHEPRRGHRQYIEVADSPYIALAVK